MLYIAFFIRDEPLMTMGDAVASFLDKEDLAIQDMCISARKDFIDIRGYKAGPRQWADTRYRWKDVTSKMRRTVTVVMYYNTHSVPRHQYTDALDQVSDSSGRRWQTLVDGHPCFTRRHRNI
jgi:hypothetical protein